MSKKSNASVYTPSANRGQSLQNDAGATPHQPYAKIAGSPAYRALTPADNRAILRLLTAPVVHDVVFKVSRNLPTALLSR